MIILKCAYCGKEFKTYPSKIKLGRGKYCSKDCFHKADRVKITKICPTCKKSFLTYDKYKHCSRECATKATIVDDIKEICQCCGKTFYYKSKYAKHPHKYCSWSCAAKHRKRGKMSEETKRKIGEANIGHTMPPESRKILSIMHSGEKSIFWKGGISFGPYCPKFNKTLKRETREKFNRICFLCGVSENGRQHCIHHIDYNKNAICKGRKWALIPLCQSCHSKTNFDRWHWFNLLINYWAMNPDINIGVGDPGLCTIAMV